jgi:hypothetical protein
MYVWWGRSKNKGRGVHGWWGKKGKKKKKKKKEGGGEYTMEQREGEENGKGSILGVVKKIK